MEINIIKAFQSIANSFLDVVFWIITKMGEEIFFLLLFAGIYLLYSKKFSFKFTLYYLTSVAVNAVIKLIIRRPRPYVASSEVVDRLHASEYSFPSGHSQGYFVEATVITQEVGKSNTKKWLKITTLCVLAVLGVLVMMSRLYWGQHYPSDTIVGAMLGMSIPFIIDIIWKYVPKKFKEKCTAELFCKVLFVVCVAGAIGFGLLDIIWGIASRKVYMFLGMYTAVSFGYLFDKKYIKYDEKSTKKTGIIKFFITYGVLVALYLPSRLLFDFAKWIYYPVFLVLGTTVSMLLPYIFSLMFRQKCDTLGSNEEAQN